MKKSIPLCTFAALACVFATASNARADYVSDDVLTVSGGPGQSATLALTNDVLQVPSGMIIGANGGTGIVELVNTPASFYRQSNDSRGDLHLGWYGSSAGTPSYGRLVLDGSDVTEIKYLYSGYQFPTDGTFAGTTVGELVLRGDSSLQVFNAYNYGDGDTRFRFEGGRFRLHGAVGNTGATGVNNGGNFYMEADAPYNIRLEMPDAEHNLRLGHGAGHTILRGTGGLEKLGAGTLVLGHVEGGGTDLLYTGDTIVSQGTVKFVTNTDYLPHGTNAGDLVIGEHGTVDLNGKSQTVNGLSGAGSVISSGSAATLTIGDADTSGDLFYLNMGANTSLRKIGAGTFTHIPSLSGNLAVEDGKAVVQDHTVDAEGITAKWFRFTIRQTRDNACITQFSEFRLFDAEGQRQGTGLTEATRGTAPENLAPGQGCFTLDCIAQPSINNLFDENNTSKCDMIGTNSWIDGWWYQSAPINAADPDSWVTFVIRLPNSAAPVVSYDIVQHTNPGEWNRLPVAWTLECSKDGLFWATVDTQDGVDPDPYAYGLPYATGPNEDGTYPISDKGLFPVEREKLAAADVSVGNGAMLVVDNIDYRVASLANDFGNVVLTNDAALVADVPAAATNAFAWVDVSGDGSFEKTGGGALRMTGASTYSGDTLVSAGTLSLCPGTFSEKFYRVTFRQNLGGDSVFQLAEFGLFDRAGNCQTLGLQNAGACSDPASLQAGTFQYICDRYWGEPPERLFNGNYSDRWCAIPNGEWIPINESNTSAWVTVVMRLADDAAPIASYNLYPATYNEWIRNPNSWLLECSADGTTWRTIADVRAADGYDIPRTYSDWYAAGGYPLLNDAVIVGVQTIPATSTVEVKSGATLEVNTTATKIGSLRIDAAAGAGTITYFRPAPNGTLYLTNVTRISDVAVLPIEVESVEDIAAVKSWNVVANGRPVGARVSYANGHLVLTAPGTVFLVK